MRLHYFNKKSLMHVPGFLHFHDKRSKNAKIVKVAHTSKVIIAKAANLF